MTVYRRVGWAWMRQPSLRGWDVYGVYGTRPGQLAAQFCGWFANDGTWNPMSPEWLERFGERQWVTRDWYGLKLDEHLPTYGDDGLLDCSCGWSRKLGNRGLAEVEWGAHTSDIRPQQG